MIPADFGLAIVDFGPVGHTVGHNDDGCAMGLRRRGAAKAGDTVRVCSALVLQKLPARGPDVAYVCPPLDEQTFVPQVY
jgi:hypothetical protein